MKARQLFLIFFITITSISISLAGNPLAGNYTINAMDVPSATNFTSVTAFADSINLNGISADVIAVIIPGTGPYQGPVVFNNISGTGPSASVTLYGSMETISALTTTTDRHVVRLSNSQYFNISNLRIERDPASSGGFYGIHIFGTGNNINITNCEVDMSGTTSTLYGAYVASGSETSILTAGDFHDIAILNCTSHGGGYGASVFGLLSNLATGIYITSNSFYDFHSNGVYLRETDGTIVSDNFFDKSTSNVTSVNAIQVAQAANINTQIFNNRIRVGQISNGSVTFRGIYLFDGTGHRVYNNVIYDINLISGNVTGIEVRTGATAPEIYFNTISIDNPNVTTGNLYGIKEELSNTNSILRNNLISISQPTSGTKAGLVIGATATPTSAFNSNYNDIYVPGGNVAMKGSLTPVLYPTLLDWQTVSNQDANSIITDPQFVSLTQPVPTNPSMDNAGTPIPGILFDITGALRGPVPDIGAYEFMPVGLSEAPSTPSILLYPNPATDFLQVDFRGTDVLPAKVAIFDSKGKMVWNGELHSEKNVLPVKSFSDGVYRLQILNCRSCASVAFGIMK